MRLSYIGKLVSAFFVEKCSLKRFHRVPVLNSYFIFHIREFTDLLGLPGARRLCSFGSEGSTWGASTNDAILVALYRVDSRICWIREKLITLHCYQGYYYN